MCELPDADGAICANDSQGGFASWSGCTADGHNSTRRVYSLAK